MPQRATDDDRRRMAEARRLLFSAGDPAGALAQARPLLKRWPGDPDLLTLVGSAHLQLGAMADARRALRKALQQRPTPEAHHLLARSYIQQGDPRRALDAAEPGLRLDPRDAALLADKAEALYMLADYRAGADALADAIAQPRPPIPVVLAYARLCHRVDEHRRGIDLLRDLLERDDLPPPARVPVLHALGDLLDRVGDHDHAFDAYRRANEARALRWDPDRWRRAVDHARAAWTTDAVDAIRTTNTARPAPVLIVGMPRSGTSLVEQILASHSAVGAGGELRELTLIARELGADDLAPSIHTDPASIGPGAVARAARRYATALRRKAGGTRLATDKMPTNLANLGLAAAMLPGARVVRCVRDPLDTCLSCYFQNFADGLPFACDLAHLGALHVGFDRLMDHWKRVLDLPVLDLDYAGLVADPIPVSRRMLEFLGLEWEDACATFWKTDAVMNTASLDQVRRPVYTTSVGRWRNYERHLEPLRRALAEQEP